MKKLSLSYPSGPQFVGDPIDVVTGAFVDVQQEFVLPGPVPLDWRRHYDSAQARQPFSLGNGQSHSLEHALQFDLDGVRYVGPSGRIITFPDVPPVGRRLKKGTCELRRISATELVLIEVQRAPLTFAISPGATKARLVAVGFGRARLRPGYDGQGRLREIQTDEGLYVRIEMDAAGRVIRVARGLPGGSFGPLVAYAYDARGNLVAGADAYGAKFSFGFDPANRLVRRTDKRGYSFHFAYDALGRCVHSRGDDGAYEVWLEYQPEQHVTVVVRHDGGRWAYEYDDAGAVVRVIDPYGEPQEYQYGESGQLAAVTDAYGRTSKILHDGTGRRLWRLSSGGVPLAADGSWALPNPGWPHRPALPRHWQWGLTGLTRTAHEDPRVARQAETARSAKSPFRLISSEAEPSPNVLPQYDYVGRVLQRPASDGSSRHLLYDANGNVDQVVDAEGRSYGFGHGGNDFRTGTVDPLGRSTRQTRSPVDLLLSFTDPNGNVSVYTRDLKDRITRIVRGGAVRDEYRYDDATGFVERFDGGNSLLYREARDLGGVVHQRWLASGQHQAFAFDDTGRLSTAVEGDLEVSFAYSPGGQIAAEQCGDFALAHELSPQGHRSSTTLLRRFTTRYREGGHRAKEIVDPRGQVHRIEFLGSTSLVRVHPNGVRERSTYAHDGVCLTRAAESVRRSSSARTTSYRWSPERDLLQVIDSAEGITRYDYDHAHRLAAAVRPDGTRQIFRFDLADNLLAQPGLASVRVAAANRVVAADGATFEYDAHHRTCARLVNGAVTHFRHDELDRLIGVTWNGGEWSARYDALGRRVETRFGERRTRFVWDRDRLAAELSSDGALRIYVYADASALVPLLFVQYDSLDTPPERGRGYVILTDHHGAPIRVVDDAGDTVWSARIEPFGRAHVHPGAAVELNLRWPGHYYDPPTGLHHNGLRYYIPELGRYLEPDPWGVNGGSNVYAYTPNPTSRVDVRGRCPTDEPPPTKTPPRSDEGDDPASERPTNPGIAIASFKEEVNGGSIVIWGDEEWRAAVKGDLDKIAGTPTGAKLLQDISDNHAKDGTKIDINPGAKPTSESPREARISSDGSPGKPSSSEVYYTPDSQNPNGPRSPNSPSDVILFHELSHGQNAQQGDSQTSYADTDDPIPPNSDTTAPNREEERTVDHENEYRDDQNLRPRDNYAHDP